MSRRQTLWVLAALVFILPFATYVPAVVHDYGFRDDYPLLLEARTEPGKITRVCASQGRPIYGWVVEQAMRAAGDVEGLRWIRLGGVTMLALTGVFAFFILLGAGWWPGYAAALSALLVLTPSAQVFMSWATAAPLTSALLLGTSAFALVEWSTKAKGRSGALVAAWVLVAVGGLVYPPNTLFLIVLFTATLVRRDTETWTQTLRWAVRHGLVVFTGLATSLAVIEVGFSRQWFPRSHRIRFEHDWPGKLGWMVKNVLPDALAAPLLDHNPGRPGAVYWAVAGAVALVIAVGAYLEWRRRGAFALSRWVLGMIGLSCVAYSVSLVAGERWPSYRTAWALTGVWSVFLVAAFSNVRHRAAAVVLAAFVLGSAYLAQRHTLELFATPQSREYALLEDGVAKARATPGSKLFVVTANQGESWAPMRYGDEFGSITFDAPWIALTAVRVMIPERPVDSFGAGPDTPPAGDYQVIVDMRALKH